MWGSFTVLGLLFLKAQTFEDRKSYVFPYDAKMEGKLLDLNSWIKIMQCITFIHISDLFIHSHRVVWS